MIEASNPMLSSHVWKLIIAAIIILVLAVLLSGFVVPWRKKRVGERLRASREGTPAEAAIGTPGAKQSDDTQAGGGPGWMSLATQSVVGMFFGKDGRLSTSTTVAWLWTLVIGWGILVVIVEWSTSISDALTHFDGTYIALLGGPYAGYILARVTVGYKVKKGTLQKPKGDGVPRLSDLVSGDDGSPDLFDMQYILFNLLAMAFVVQSLWRSTGAGFPSIPAAMVILTAGPAALYATNKAATSNAPIIFSVSPGVVNAGNQFTVFGQNFLGGAAPGTGAESKITVLVNGVDATNPSEPANPVNRASPAKPAMAPPGSATDSSVTATAPSLDYTVDTPVQVAVTTASGAQAVLNNALVVHRPPTLHGLDLATAHSRDVATIEGAWYASAPISVVVTWLDGGAQKTAAVAGRALEPSHSAQFTVPQTGSTPAVTATVQVWQYDQPSATTATLNITG